MEHWREHETCYRLTRDVPVFPQNGIARAARVKDPEGINAWSENARTECIGQRTAEQRDKYQMPRGDTTSRGLVPHARTLGVLYGHVEVACGALLRSERQCKPGRHGQHRHKS